MPNKQVYNRRIWLRPVNNYANHSSVIGTIHSFKSGKESTHNKVISVDARLTLTDCNRSVTFDFMAYGSTAKAKAEAKAHLKMMDKLINELQEFRAEYERQISNNK